MKQVFKIYGQFLLEGVAIVGIIALWFGQGIYKEIGANLPIYTMTYDTYEDFREIYCQESQKKAPEITYVKGSIYTGKYLLLDLVEAYDYAGRSLSIEVYSILNPKKEERVDVYDANTTRMEFDMAGIYVLTVGAVDDGNRYSECTIKIPVNK